MLVAKWNDTPAGVRIADEAGLKFYPDSDVVLSFWYDAELRGGVIYRDFTGRSCQMHVASFRRRWLTTAFLWEAFYYPFEIRQCEVVFGYIPSSNLTSQKFAYNLGFKLVSVIKDVFNDGDLLVLALYKDECRFLAPPAWR